MQDAAAKHSCIASANSSRCSAFSTHEISFSRESSMADDTHTQPHAQAMKGERKKTLLDDFIVRVYCQFTTAAKTIDKVCVGRHQHEYIAVVRFSFSLKIPFTTHKWLYVCVCVIHPLSLSIHEQDTYVRCLNEAIQNLKSTSNTTELWLCSRLRITSEIKTLKCFGFLNCCGSRMHSSQSQTHTQRIKLSGRLYGSMNVSMFFLHVLHCIVWKIIFINNAREGDDGWDKAAIEKEINCLKLAYTALVYVGWHTHTHSRAAQNNKFFISGVPFVVAHHHENNNNNNERDSGSKCVES